MKIFFDFEMTGLHQHTTPISLGMVAETGQTLYAEFTDYDRSQIDDWLQDNVIDNLVLGEAENNLTTMIGHPASKAWTILGRQRHIGVGVKEWLRQFDTVEMWGDVLAYDWMLFCELFPVEEGGSTAERLPKNIYYIPFDLATLMKAKGVDPDISRELFVGQSEHIVSEMKKHNALHDAEVIRLCYMKLMVML